MDGIELIGISKVVDCINQCYEGGFIENPYYTRQYGGDTPDFGPQDHSKKNNPFDRGLEYENFCPDPEPPALDAPFPRIGQGAEMGLEQTLSLDPMDGSANGSSGENMELATDSSSLDTVDGNPGSIFDGTVDPSPNIFDSNAIASAGAGASAPDYGYDSVLPDSTVETTFTAQDASANSMENLFLGPDTDGSSYTLASLDEF